MITFNNAYILPVFDACACGRVGLTIVLFNSFTICYRCCCSLHDTFCYNQTSDLKFIPRHYPKANLE